MAVITCWAKNLGGCDEQSGEHPVTKGLFTDKMITVQGLPWCKDKPVRVGINSLTRNILCKKHNSALSILDDTVIETTELVEKSVQLTHTRMPFEDRRWAVERFRINATFLERWLLKTLINITYEGSERIGPNAEDFGVPSNDLVEIAFGLRGFSANAGLFIVYEPNEPVTYGQQFTIIPLFDTSKKLLVGGAFYLKGFKLILCLLEKGITPKDNLVQPDGRVVQHQFPQRHPKELLMKVHINSNYVSHVFDFDWS
jgi:hypothetical protein